MLSPVFKVNQYRLNRSRLNNMRFILIFFIQFVIVKSDWIFCNHEVREIGDPCITATTNENGFCKIPDDCRSVFRNPHQRPSICGFSDTTPIVCCPSEPEMKPEMNIIKINDSCSIKGIDGICKPSEDCNPLTGISSQQFYLCSYTNGIAIVCCPNKIPPVMFLYQDEIIEKPKVKPEIDSKTVDVGSSCLVNTTSEKGMCRLIDDCELLLDAKSNLCNPGVSSNIVCCPLKKEIVVEEKIDNEDEESLDDYLNNLTNITIPVSEYLRLPIECVVNKTGESGLHRLLEHCPALQRDITNGIEVPIICEEEFCRDLVCCPLAVDNNRRRQSIILNSL